MRLNRENCIYLYIYRWIVNQNEWNETKRIVFSDTFISFFFILIFKINRFMLLILSYLIAEITIDGCLEPQWMHKGWSIYHCWLTVSFVGNACSYTNGKNIYSKFVCTNVGVICYKSNLILLFFFLNRHGAFIFRKNIKFYWKGDHRNNANASGYWSQ